MTNAETAARQAPQLFSARVAIILFLVGVFAFSAFITLSTFAPELRESDVRAHAISRSAVGYAAFVRLLRETGASVKVSRGQPSSHEEYGEIVIVSQLVVLAPDEELSFDDIKRVAGSSTVLIVLPKWHAFPSFKKPGWVIESGPMIETSVEGILAEIAPKAKVSRESATMQPAITVDWRQTRSLKLDERLRPGKIASLQTISAPNIIPVAKTHDGKTVLGVIRNDDHADIFVLSEPDLFNTQGIANIETARAGRDIIDALRRDGDAIVFDVTLNGYARTRNLLRLAFEPPLLAATLSFVIVAALIAWRAATRQGPTITAHRALAYGKRILADNSAALVRLTGREHTMAPRYAEFIRTIAAERIGVGRDGKETTSAELDRIAQARGLSQPFSTLAAEAAAASTAADALAAARKLHAWTEEIIRATR